MSANTATEFFPNFATVRSVLEAAQIGIWSWEIATNKVTWSSNLEAIHHLPAGSFDGTYASFERDIRRDDLPSGRGLDQRGAARSWRISGALSIG